MAAAADKALIEAACADLSGDMDPLQLVDFTTQNADAVQEELLSAILKLNATSKYLRGLGLNGCTDRHTFKRLVPVVTYDDILPYIRRIANGDKSPLLCVHPVTELICSSGTSGGERKLIPSVEFDCMRRTYVYNAVIPAINKQSAGGLDDGKSMCFYFVKPEITTPGGLRARTITTRLIGGKYSLHGIEAGRNPYTSPLEAMLCQDVVQSMYCQITCGLAQREDVTSIRTLFASTVIRVVQFMSERWEELLEDIKQRRLVSGLVTDNNLRKAVEAVLATSTGSGAVAAAEMENEFQRANFQQGILKRLWPKAKYVDAILTGSMEQYIPTLDFFAGGIPLVSSFYACSECFAGINLMPFCPPSSVCYTLLPNMAFFEFLPLSEEVSISEPVDLVDVQVGMDYELVVTTFSGLYRYRVGDVLKVKGFHNKAPLFSFVCRRNVVLAIDMDKTDEAMLQRAIKTATAKHLEATGYRLVGFSSYADVSSIPGHYVLFWELNCERNASTPTSAGTMASKNDDHTLSALPSFPDSFVFEECCLTIENSLDSVYRQGRVCNNSIGPLEIRLVQSGTFNALMEYCLAQGASLSQYKTPLCVKSGPLLDLLNCKVTHGFFSHKVPDLGK